MAQNPYLPFLEDMPETLYNALIPQGSNSFANYSKNKFGNVYGDYMGQLGKMALKGQEPNLSFYDYMQNYPFMKDWYSMSPSQRGINTPSSLRWNV